MLVKLGRMWVESSRIVGIVSPPLPLDEKMITNKFFVVGVILREYGHFNVSEHDTYKEASEAVDTFALIVNSCSQSSYPEAPVDNPANA